MSLPILGEKANQLVQSSIRSERSGQVLLPYEDQIIAQLIPETRSLLTQYAQIKYNREQASLEGDADTDVTNPGNNARELMIQLVVERNQRALLIYHEQRLRCLKNLFWRSGANESAVLSPYDASAKSSRTNMTPAEVSFLKSYADIVRKFKEPFLPVHDIAGGGWEENPPSDIYVTVRSLYDIGEIQLADGTITLTKGTQFYLLKDLVEPLLVQKCLELVE